MNLLSLIKNLFCRKRGVVTIGKGYDNARALHRVLCETKSEAIKAKHNNYRRSIQRILDEVKN